MVVDRADPKGLARLFDPGSIAFVGGHRARLAARETKRLGFEGDTWMVHPDGEFTELAQLPAVPDAVFLGVGAERSVQLVADAARLGVAGCVVYAAGFAEAGHLELQDAVVDAAGTMPLIGPNCHGFVNALSGAVLWPDIVGGGRVERGAALITQSGNIAIDVTMQQRGLDIAAVVTVGNQANVDIAAVIGALVEDHRIGAIGLHVEGIPDVEAFVDAAMKAVDRGVPIVALATGSSRRGSEIVSTHTASLVDSMTARRAMLTRYGITLVADVEELVGALSILDRRGRLGGHKVISLSCSGGEASLMADLAETTRLDFADLSSSAAAAIDEVLDGQVSISNPFDYHTFIWGDAERLGRCFRLALEDGFDAAVLVIDVPATDMDIAEWWVALDAFCDAAAATGVVGVVTATLPESLPGEVARQLTQRGVAVVPGLRSCLKALEASLPVDRSPVRHHVRQVASPVETLDEWKSKLWLRHRGAAVPDSRLVEPGDIEAAGDALGFPLVAKVLGPLHKTEVGGVIVGVPDLSGLKQAVADLASLSEGPVLVERQVQDVVAELLVGVKVHSGVGWAITLGAGGTLAELIDDTVTALLPLKSGMVEDMLRSLKTGRLLEGHRGRPSGDIAAAVATIESLCELAVGEDVEIEVNPLLVCQSGAWVADAIVEVLQ